MVAPRATRRPREGSEVARLTIDLSTLSVIELDRLLAAAEARGNEELARELRREAEARRRAPVAVKPMTAFGGAAFSQAAGGEPGWSEAAYSRRAPIGAIVVSVVVLGAALAGGGLYLRRLAAPFGAAAPRAEAALTVQAPLAAPAAIDPAAAVPVELTLRPLEDAGLSQAVKVDAEPPREATPPKPARARPAARHPENPCLDLPLPGDRLVCGYPSLAIAEHQMQAAYRRAEAAGANLPALERSQADWKRSRDNTWNRQRLAQLFEERTAELEEAARPARTSLEEPPF
jgi:hypothetical protein